ncbi:MAG: magnesium/cobalt transporter CorA [Alphaproteobacteria bacterium]|nr:magnesium/cobalt transporter CorA [Alphaproteobacteria bacterium]
MAERAVPARPAASPRRRRGFGFGAPGTSPGTLRDDVGGVARVVLKTYDDAGITTVEGPTPALCEAARAKGAKTWIDIAGRPDAALLRVLGDAFHLHSLALEDVQRPGAQRPKAESYGRTLFVVLNDVERRPDGRLEIEQVSLFLGDDFVVSVHDAEGEDPFEPVRRRLDSDANPMRKRGSDYLFYALVDVVVDRKFPFLEDFGDRLEMLETEMLADATRDSVVHIQEARRALHVLRRAIWPERDVVNALVRDDDPLIGAETRIFLRDCYDHAAQIIEILETYRETASSLMDIYVSSISNRLNDIMRVLTVIATIFMPLSFIASVYGMNFEHMPELKWYWAYPAIWVVFVAVAGAMLVWFRRRRFL